MTLVALAVVVGQQRLVAQAQVVDDGDAANPVALGDFAHALDVVLATGEVPHEVAPIHVVELVVDEETQVLDERGAQAFFGGYGASVGVEGGGGVDHLALHAQPLLVLAFVPLIVDAREHHVLLGAVLVVGLAADGHIAVGVAGILLHFLGILHAPFLHHRLECARGGVLLIHHLAIERAAVDEWCLAILLTAQVLGQRIGVARRVLVERRERRTANQDERITGKAHKDDHHAEHHVGEHAHGQLLAEVEQVDGQCGGEHKRDEQALAQEQHATEHDGDDERQFHAQFAVARVEFPQCPRQRGHEHDGINEHTAIERQAQRVHGEQVEVLTQFHKAGLQAVEDEHDDDKRHQQRNERPLDVGLAPLAVVEHQCDSRDAQQVEQVHAQRHAKHVGNQDEPAVAAGLVGVVFPLECQPEHQGGAERREGIDLGLHSREPERVAPGVGQGTGDATAHNHQVLRQREIPVVIGFHQSSHQMRDGPEQQQDGCRAEQGAHGVDALGHRHHVAASKVCRKARGKDEDGVAGRMAYFALKTLCNEFGAVPKTGCGLQREQVGHSGYQEYEPADGVVDKSEFFHRLF